MPTDDRPNLLFVFADQMRGMDMRCAGNADLITPSLDRLAAEGVRCTRACATTPICSPNRATLLTGTYPTTHGLMFNDTVWRRDLPTLASEMPSAIFTRLEDVYPLVVFALWMQSAGTEQDVLENYLSRWRHVAPRTDGHTLKELGLSPSPVYKEILHRIRDAWLDGEIKSEKEEGQLLHRLIEELQG